MQTDNKFFDDLAKLGQSAAGTLHGVKGEFETMFRTRLEYILKDMDLVSREEFDVVRDMVKQARTKNEILEQKIIALEKQLFEKQAMTKKTTKAKMRKDTKK